MCGADSPGEFPSGDLFWGKVPPRRVGPYPALGKGGDSGGSGVGPLQNREYLRGTEWPWGSVKCGMAATSGIGKGYDVEMRFSTDWKNRKMGCGMLCKRNESYRELRLLC